MDATTMELIEHFINTLGFPIVMVAYFIWDKYKVTNKLIEVIDNNTNVSRMIAVKLGIANIDEDTEKEVV